MAVVGPGADGARLEGSKAYMKEFLAAAGVPTARTGPSTTPAAADEFLRSMTPPYVVKTDGLAAGKGVLVTDDLDEAVADVRAKLSGAAFGDGRRDGSSSRRGWPGPSARCFVLCDGRDAVALAPSRDYKRLGEGDTGPNTGGMGAYAPLPEFGVDDLVGR